MLSKEIVGATGTGYTEMLIDGDTEVHPSTICSSSALIE